MDIFPVISSGQFPEWRWFGMWSREEIVRNYSSTVCTKLVSVQWHCGTWSVQTTSVVCWIQTRLWDMFHAKIWWGIHKPLPWLQGKWPVLQAVCASVLWGVLKQLSSLWAANDTSFLQTLIGEGNIASITCPDTNCTAKLTDTLLQSLLPSSTYTR